MANEFLKEKLHRGGEVKANDKVEKLARSDGPRHISAPVAAIMPGLGLAAVVSEHKHIPRRTIHVPAVHECRICEHKEPQRDHVELHEYRAVVGSHFEERHDTV